MSRENLEMVRSTLESRSPVRQEGKGWRTRCPNSGHEDQHPSFFLYPGGGGRCFSQCNQYWPPTELARLLRIELPEVKEGLTREELAYAKGLPEEFLRDCGVTNGIVGSGKNRRPCVDIPYVDLKGEIIAVHKRLSLHSSPRFIWRKGDRTTLYGLSRLGNIKKAGRVILVEGETDCWTLWLHEIPALGVPGASTWKEEFASLLQGLEVYLWHEPDSGGDELVRTVSKDLPDLRVMEPQANV